MIKSSKKGRRGSKDLRISLDLIATRQTSLRKLMIKYLLDDKIQSNIQEAFADHTMDHLLYQNHCPFHKFQHQQSSIIEEPHPQQIQFESNADTDNANIQPKLSPSFQLPPLKLSAKVKEDARINITLPQMILKKNISLDAISANPSLIESKSTETAQFIIKPRDHNKTIGDSMLHFLKLYFKLIWQDSKSVDQRDNFDQILVERYLKYLTTLHKDYLIGNLGGNVRRSSTDRNMSPNQVYAARDDQKCNTDDVSDDIPEFNAANAISMDEYRIFVEYMCELFERDIMRQHPGFQDGDLIFIDSLRYHLSKLALCLAGKLAPETLIGTDRKSSIYSTFVTLSQRTLHKIIPKLKKSSRSSVY